MFVATASDTDGSVSRVEFYEGATKLGQILSPPYQYSWIAPTAGNCSLAAVTTDNLGVSTTSVPIVIGLSATNQPPAVNLSTPVNGAQVNVGAAVTVTAVANDLDGSIARVEFFAGSTPIGQALGAPYSVMWSAAAVGSYSLTAVAYDNLGSSTTSAAINIGVVSPVDNGWPRRIRRRSVREGGRR